MPLKAGLTPSRQKHMLFKAGMTPFCQKHMPLKAGLTPSCQKHMPHKVGMIPSCQKHMNYVLFKCTQRSTPTDACFRESSRAGVFARSIK